MWKPSSACITLVVLDYLYKLNCFFSPYCCHCVVVLLLYSYFHGLCAFVWFCQRQKCLLRFIIGHLHASLTSRPGVTKLFELRATSLEPIMQRATSLIYICEIKHFAQFIFNSVIIRDRRIYWADIWVLPIYWYQPKRTKCYCTVFLIHTDNLCKKAQWNKWRQLPCNNANRCVFINKHTRWTM